jgi:hypothetical protein
LTRTTGPGVTRRATVGVLSTHVGAILEAGFRGMAMKNSNPSGSKLHFATTGQRLLAVWLFAVYATLIWLAWTGRFDAQINAMAAWLRDHYNALVH